MFEIIVFALVFYVFYKGIVWINQLAGNDLGKKVSCPRCHNYGMKTRGGRYYRNGISGSDWYCPHCDYEFFK